MSVRASLQSPAKPETSPVATDDSLGDLRFRNLLAAEQWAALSPSIRRRFSKRLAGGRTISYSGQVTEMAMNRAGRLLAKAARLIGGPLPLSCDTDVASLVAVTEDVAQGGQVWTRIYTRRSGFPQVIHSAKRFGGPTGLEEHVGCGIGMALEVSVRDGVLHFESDAYFIALGSWRLRLPRLLTPGRLIVTHSEIDATRFAFTLDIHHPRFGHLLHQRAVYSEV